MELIYSVKKIFSAYLHEGEKFIIPAYQRGYKWKSKDIKQLLNDINTFHTYGDEDVFYCLQNITLVKNNNNYNVVDGQQRLTTLSLLLAYIGKQKLIQEKLQYDIRNESQKFLVEYVFDNKLKFFKNNEQVEGDSLLEWDQLGIDNKDEFNFQDIFYMYNAYITIDQWFRGHQEVKKEMIEKILNHVKLIVNLPQITSFQELELFDNLNGKRVSLDGADLIRAMIITRVARREVDYIEDVVKHDVILNESRIKNGLKLDEINTWWCGKSRQEYFSVFTRNINSKGENIKFQEITYPIDILLKLYIQTKNGIMSLNIDDKDIFEKASGTIKLQYFESAQNISKVLEELKELQRLIECWYGDAELYHLVLFSALYLGKNFYQLTNLWYSNNRKSFVDCLKKSIKDNEYIKLALEKTNEQGNSLSEDDLNFKQNWYEGDNTNMIPVMILLDVIRILASKVSKFPIANLDPFHFRCVKEDKEHIFPQTPLNIGFSLDVLKYYIKIAFDCGYKPLHMNEKRTFTLVDYYEDKLLTNEKFRIWFNNKITTGIIPLNSLGNVCLLQDKVNRSYGNDSFTQKHFDIMTKFANGEYIRPHVLDAFTKIMAAKAQRKDFAYMQMWTKDDIFTRRQYIISQIENYLN